MSLRAPEGKTVKNRLHLDLRPADQPAEIARLEALGTRQVSISQGNVSWVAMADPDGNEFDVLQPLAPGELPPGHSRGYTAEAKRLRLRRLHHGAGGRADGPLSDDHGIGRGTPIVRAYIEEFLGQHQEAIRGSVLEVSDSRYTASFGTGRVTTSTVVDIDRASRQATLIADLSEPGALPGDSFDCIILTEVLHLLKGPGTCLRSCHGALREEGSVLITVPALKRAEVQG